MIEAQSIKTSSCIAHMPTG